MARHPPRGGHSRYPLETAWCRTARSRPHGRHAAPDGLKDFGWGASCIVGCASAAFATAALWQLGAVVDGMVESPLGDGDVDAGDIDVATSTGRAVRPDPSGAAVEHRGRALRNDACFARSARQRPVARQLGDLADRSRQRRRLPKKIVPLGAEPEPSYERTECGDVFVYIVSIAEAAPMASAASLAIGKGSPARFRRPGQRIGDWEVLAITDDWSGANPGVWLLKDNAVCRAELAGNPTRVHVPLKQAKTADHGRGRRRRRARR